MANSTGLTLPQLFFFRASSLEEIQAEVLRINLESPPTKSNSRIFNAPVKDDSDWVITWMEFTRIEIDIDSIRRDNDS